MLNLDAINPNLEITVYGDGMQTRDFIHVKDVARANVAALESDLTGVCNVGTNTGSTLLDLIKSRSGGPNLGSKVRHLAPREGDIRHSQTNILRMNQQLGVHAKTDILDGLDELPKD